MQPDELDRLFGEDDIINPSKDFTARVMRDVLREAEVSRGIVFPWKPVCIGIISAAVALGIGLVTETPRPVLASQSGLMVESLQSWAAHLETAVMNTAAGALALFTLALVALATLLPIAVYESYQRDRG